MGRLLFLITNVIIIIISIVFFMIYLSNTAQIEQLEFAARNRDVSRVTNTIYYFRFRVIFRPHCDSVLKERGCRFGYFIHWYLRNDIFQHHSSGCVCGKNLSSSFKFKI